jgi:hypothetical protein
MIKIMYFNSLFQRGKRGTRWKSKKDRDRKKMADERRYETNDAR